MLSFEREKKPSPHNSTRKGFYSIGKSRGIVGKHYAVLTQHARVRPKRRDKDGPLFTINFIIIPDFFFSVVGRLFDSGVPPSPPNLWNHRVSGKSPNSLWVSIT